MDDDQRKFIIFFIIPVMVGLVFYSSIDNKKRAFEAGATLVYNHARDVEFLAKRKGAILLDDITSIVQDKKKYNLLFCDLIDDDELKKIQQELLEEKKKEWANILGRKE